ncbi:glia maturation factor gamma-like [Ctenocephalides felis]|uniref:glia maturation factor gamma-like n=1 Tax=Ctenocephalides felis TaxID=7515 RepID=UPI000E6E1A92|nr:glia maturation factor gamma-like [Ctenocephalides felis]
MSQANVKVCDIGPEVKEALRKFRFRKNNNNAALILKVDRERQAICIDEEIEDVALEDLQDTLPGHQPRYVIYSYCMEHKDGRLSYPMCFIYYTPRDSQMELQIMYAGTKLALQHEVELTRSYEVRELDELTEDWLREKLSK